jgi:hypothetical protein
VSVTISPAVIITTTPSGRLGIVSRITTAGYKNRNFSIIIKRNVPRQIK